MKSSIGTRISHFLRVLALNWLLYRNLNVGFSSPFYLSPPIFLLLQKINIYKASELDKHLAIMNYQAIWKNHY